VKVILLGATGMVGQGVLPECLLDPEVESVLTIGRNAIVERPTPRSGLLSWVLPPLDAIIVAIARYVRSLHPAPQLDQGRRRTDD
jgi:hypothetical protein